LQVPGTFGSISPGRAGLAAKIGFLQSKRLGSPGGFPVLSSMQGEQVRIMIVRAGGQQALRAWEAIILAKAAIIDPAFNLAWQLTACWFFATPEADSSQSAWPTILTSESIAGHMTDASTWDEAPRHLIRDRDGAFGPEFTGRIRAMGIRDHSTAPWSPKRNEHVERLIGSIRRESLDHLVALGGTHLRDVLKNDASYYNKVRPHLSSHEDVPDFRRTQRIGPIAAIPILGGMHHQDIRV
jgi:hypothetical protein